MAKKYVQPAAVSIFAVIFAALLLTILTVGFIKLMLAEQQRATNNDLSQSAYDAALAGVEDAKRTLRACTSGNNTACTALQATHDCKVIARAGIAGNATDEETIIQSSSENGQEFNQAYTCVNIAMDTPDFLYEATEGRSRMIPLKASGEFNAVVIEWLTQQDIGAGQMPTAPAGASSDLPTKASWGAATPPLMRAQLITPGQTFQISDLDGSAASQTVFLRPSALSAGQTNFDVSVEPGARPRSTSPLEEYSNTPLAVTCSRMFANDAYACKATLRLGRVVVPEDSINAFLRLTPVYRGATVRASLRLDDQIVNFNGAQPSVDATGRTSNLFRRVEARLQIGDDFPYPNYAIDAAGSICKDFSVDTTSATAGVCTP